MNTSTSSTPSMATLTLPLASLSAIPPVDGEALPVIQLTPDGSFAARDGRPGTLDKVSVKCWTLTPQIAAAVLNLWKQRATPLVIDYEHQSLHARENGQPAPAAGWIESLRYEPGRGLLAAVHWTTRAREHIAADEYRYISPTFTFDPKTGAVLELKSAALTNTPALDGLPAVAASETIPETFCAENPMSLEKRVKELLGLPADTPDTAVEAALSETLTKASQPPAPDSPDPAKYAPMAALTDLQNANEALQAKVAALTAAHADAERSHIEKTIDVALADGRLSKATETWARGLAKASPESLTAFLNAAAPIAALSAMQSGGVSIPETKPEAALSAAALYACQVLGMTEAEYLTAEKGEK